MEHVISVKPSQCPDHMPGSKVQNYDMGFKVFVLVKSGCSLFHRMSMLHCV